MSEAERTLMGGLTRPMWGAIRRRVKRFVGARFAGERFVEERFVDLPRAILFRTERILFSTNRRFV